MVPIIHPSALLKLHPSDFILIDASAGSKARYDEKHLAGAAYIDLDRDLADIKSDAANGGRHPLPAPAKFGEVLGRLGIDSESYVVIYDDKNGSNAAARLWWMLKAVGHEKVKVLDGGFQAALEAGFPTDANLPVPNVKASYPVGSWQLPLIGMNDVETAGKNGQLIIDVRSRERFDGLTEPIDLIAGHIPGATNIPFTENLDEKGFFLAPAVLREKYNTAMADIGPTKVTVHCGSGVTACHTLLAMDYAGLPMPNLYVGSWSEWSRNNREMVMHEASGE
jgi:thiosulfate/3-mercaptopyruvate sulfurtransferase